jgi:hypothetical protein
MAFKFFSIVKANAEVSRLETELATAQERIKAFEVAEPENLSALQAELSASKAELEKASEAVKSLAAKDAEIAALKDAATKLEASVEERASAKALAITQSQGRAKPVAAEKPEAKTITRAELSKMSPAEQAAHFRAGGKITE